jgi:hypothetical protein
MRLSYLEGSITGTRDCTTSFPGFLSPDSRVIFEDDLTREVVPLSDMISYRW